VGLLQSIAAHPKEDYRSDTQLEASACFSVGGGCVMGRAISGHLNDGATEPEKRQRRAEAHKIRKMIRKCKADTKAIKQLDDEQTEFLERLRKHP
jgi:hypothetical protein